MKLLAFDTSTEYLSLAVQNADEVFTYDVLAGQTHSQIILPQIQALLETAGLQLKDLQGIAFGAGPGSFTGVRIAAGVAQGLGFGSNLPVVGVCTLEALAEASGATKVIACLDARMCEVYHAVYEKTASNENATDSKNVASSENAARWRTVIEPGLYKPDAVPAVSGNDWIGGGSGWQTYGEILSNGYDGQTISTMPALLPTASAILKLAKPIFANGDAKSAHDAMPIYIRNRVALKTAEREQGLRL